MALMWMNVVDRRAIFGAEYVRIAQNSPEIEGESWVEINYKEAWRWPAKHTKYTKRRQGRTWRGAVAESEEGPLKGCRQRRHLGDAASADRLRDEFGLQLNAGGARCGEEKVRVSGRILPVIFLGRKGPEDAGIARK